MMNKRIDSEKRKHVRIISIEDNCIVVHVNKNETYQIEELFLLKL